MRVMMICNTDGALYVFRRPIIEALLGKGVSVATVSGKSAYVERLSVMGVRVYAIDFPRHSLSPISNLRLFLDLVKCIRSECPDIVHCFTHKPAIFGTLAARICGVKRLFVTVTGLGTLYARDSKRAQILQLFLRLQYRVATTFASTVFFQNPDDLEEFVGNGAVDARKALLTRGSGIDVSSIQPPNKEQRRSARHRLMEEIGSFGEAAKIVLLPARAVPEKGVAEFYQAATGLNAADSESYRFVHVGLIDDLSQGAFSAKNISETARKAGVHFLGFKENVLDYLAAADIVALPSYREGMPRSLLEALALGKIIVTTDAPGCRETVREGWNGFLCLPGDADSLAEAISKAAGLGKAAEIRSRTLAETTFDSKLLVAVTLEKYGVAKG